MLVDAKALNSIEQLIEDYISINVITTFLGTYSTLSFENVPRLNFNAHSMQGWDIETSK